jgi:crossover junction endodeoxyribonuclease RuvC
VRIIGIDPGSRITGYGIVDSDGQTLRLVEAGCIRIPESSFHLRLKYLFAEIHDIFKHHKPDCAAVEQVFYAKNVRSALQLGHARGVILLAISINDCRFFEYSALQVKNAITGYGRAEKSQLKRMIEMLLGTTFPNSKYDLTDALGLAITHAHISAFQKKLQRQS